MMINPDEINEFDEIKDYMSELKDYCNNQFNNSRHLKMSKCLAPQDSGFNDNKI